MDRKWWTLIAVCIGTFMLLIDVTIVNVALPDIQTSLKASFSDLQWVVDAYALTLAALLLTTGSLADLFGRRRVFAIGLCVFTLSSLLSGLATTPLFLNLARGAQGVGGAAMFSTSLALLASSFRGHERGTAFGVWGAITGLAVAIGPVVGGALTTGLSWRWIFLVNVPIGVIGLLVTLLRVQESRQPGARRPDWLGALTFSAALAALVYALIQGESVGWTSREIVGCLAGAGVLLLVFLIVELVQKAPMFDLSLFRNPTFAGGSIVAFALSAGMFALLLYLTLYLQDVLGFSALDTGLRLLCLSGGILLMSTLAGRLTTRVPISLLIGPGLILVGVGLILMRGLSAASGWEHLIPGFVVGGAGVGLINPPLASTAVGVVEPARAGMASGINSTFRQVGIATGIAGLGAVFSHSVRTKMISLLATGGVIPQPQIHVIASDVAQGSGVGAAIISAPPAARQAVVQAVRESFVGGLNQIFLIGAILSFGAALLSMVLIRNKDFEASAAYRAVSGPTPTPPAAGAPVEGATGPAGPTRATRANGAAGTAQSPAATDLAGAAADLSGAGDRVGGVDLSGAGDRVGAADAAGPGDRVGGVDLSGAGDRVGAADVSLAAGRVATVDVVGVGDRVGALDPSSGGADRVEADGGSGMGDRVGAADVAGVGDRVGALDPSSGVDDRMGADASGVGDHVGGNAPSRGTHSAGTAGEAGSTEPTDLDALPTGAPPLARPAAPNGSPPPTWASAPSSAGAAAGGPRDGDGPTAAGGPRDGDGPPAAGGPRDGDGPTAAGGPRDGDGPTAAGGPRDGDGPTAAGGPRDGDGPPAAGGPRDGDGPPAAGGPRDGDGPPAAGRPPDANGPLVPAPPASELADRSYVVALAAEQAHADCSGHVERLLARHHHARRAGSPPVAGEPPGPQADRAAALLARLHQLGDQRQRLVTALRDDIQASGDHTRAAREQTDLAARSADRVADTRRELYTLIAALAALTDEARGAAPAPEPPAASRGHGATPGAPLTG